MSFFTGLRCSLCSERFPAIALYVCDKCLGPLEATYDYDGIRGAVTRELIEARPPNLWRYRELLPIEGRPRTGFHSGWTPLIRADRLARELGLRELYIKDDSVNHPTLSYKDRVVSVAATRAVELGVTIFGCASTGNLGNSVAAHAARLGLHCYVFIPHDLEPGKVTGSAVSGPHVVAIEGNYDDVNRLCTQVGDRYGWGFANINLRAYYAEGAKTLGFEVVEQLGWRFPQHLVSPVAGGTLLPRIGRGSGSCAISAWWTASCRAFTQRRPPAARPWCTRCAKASSTPSPSSRTRLRSRSRSAIRPTATTCCAPCGRRAAAAPPQRIRRSWTRSVCWPAPRASSPNRQAGRRWRPPCT